MCFACTFLGWFVDWFAAFGLLLVKLLAGLECFLCLRAAGFRLFDVWWWLICFRGDWFVGGYAGGWVMVVYCLCLDGLLFACCLLIVLF